MKRVFKKDKKDKEKEKDKEKDKEKRLPTLEALKHNLDGLTTEELRSYLEIALQKIKEWETKYNELAFRHDELLRRVELERTYANELKQQLSAILDSSQEKSPLRRLPSVDPRDPSPRRFSERPNRRMSEDLTEDSSSTRRSRSPFIRGQSPTRNSSPSERSSSPSPSPQASPRTSSLTESTASLHSDSKSSLGSQDKSSDEESPTFEHSPAKSRLRASVDLSSLPSVTEENASSSPRKVTNRPASPEVVSQRISALVQRSRSISTTGAHPKLLVKTPTNGILNAGGAFPAPSSPRNSLPVGGIYIQPISPSRTSSSSTSQEEESPRNPRERATSDVGLLGSFHNSLQNVFVPKSNNASKLPVSPDSSKKKELRRTYRKRTATDVLGIETTLDTEPDNPSTSSESGQQRPLAQSTPASSRKSDSPASPQRPVAASSPPPGTGRVSTLSPGRRAFQQQTQHSEELAEQTREYIRSKLDPHWVLDYNDCLFEERLGKGVSSTVYRGKYKNQVVALKVLRFDTKQRDLEDFKKELEVYSQLDGAPNIVHFYGATLEPKLCIVLEYCSQGTMFHYMSDLTKTFDWEMFFRWSIEATVGLSALHNFNPPVVHRDLKSLNLLLDDNLHVKVCDFGLSRFVENDDEEKHKTLMNLRGTYAYVAPEVFQKKGYTHKADIYSMGLILWEMVARLLKGKYCRPYSEYPDLTHDFQIIMQAARGVRPTIPNGCPRSLMGLIKLCWAEQPNDRPTCKELVQALQMVNKDYLSHKSEWDALIARPQIVTPPSPRHK